MLHHLRSTGAILGLSALALASAAVAQTPEHPVPRMRSTPLPLVTPGPLQSPTPAPSPSPTATPVNAPENPLVTQRVRDAFIAWQHGHVNRRSYTPQAGGTYMDAYVEVVRPDLQIGPPQQVTYQTASLLLGDLVYRYEITGDSGTVSVLYSLDQNGKPDGIVFTPEIFRAATPSPAPQPS